MKLPHRPAGRHGRRPSLTIWLILVAFAIPAALAVVGWAAAPPSKAVLNPDPKTCEGYPEKRVYLEAQSWWEAQAGPASHPGTGKQGHIHVGTCFPLYQKLTASTLHLDVFVQLHNLPSQINNFQVDVETGGDGSNIFHSIVPGFRRTCPTADCNEWVSIDLPLKSCPSSGWAAFELIPHADTPDGKAQAVVGRWWAYIDNGKPRTREPEGCSGRRGIGWFSPAGPAGKYSGVSIANDLPWDPTTGLAKPVSGIWRPSVFIARDEALVLVDPALHANPPNFGTLDPLEQEPLEQVRATHHRHHQAHRREAPPPHRRLRHSPRRQELRRARDPIRRPERQRHSSAPAGSACPACPARLAHASRTPGAAGDA